MKQSKQIFLIITFFAILSSCTPGKEEVGVNDADKSLTVPVLSDSDIVKK
jgi:hypothetical protein